MRQCNILWIVILIVFLSLGITYSIYLDSNDVPRIGQELTLICNNASGIAVNWYRNNKNIAWAENQYENDNRCGCKFTSNSGRYHQRRGNSDACPNFTSESERYIFKECGVKHELTIKSINFYLDNGSVWRCQNYNSSEYSNNVTIIIEPPTIAIVPEQPIHGKQFTLTCKTNMDNVTWLRNGKNLTFNYNSADENGCSVGTKDESMRVTNCGHSYNLTILQVDYYRDSSVDFQCRSGAFSDQYKLYVDVLPTFITTEVPVNGNSFDITCFSTRAVSWYRKGMVEDNYIFVASSSPANANNCSVQSSYYEFKSCGSVNQTLTIKSVDFDRDNGSVWTCSFGPFPEDYTMLVTEKKVFINQSDHVFNCVYRGDPNNNITFLPWKHSIDNKLVREIEGYYINTTVYSLNITNNQSDDGNYTCTVDDGITTQKAVYNFIPTQAPPYLYGSTTKPHKFQTGADATFSAKFSLEKTKNISWNRDGQKLENNSRVTISEEPTEINHPYNNTIKLSGIKTTLTITSIIITDQGNYICDICNQYGCSHADFHLVISENVETNDEGQQDQKEVDTVIIGVSLGVTALLIIVASVIFVVILKRRRNSGQPMSAPEKDINTTDPPKPVIIENDLYVSIDTELPTNQRLQEDMEIIENDLYVSSDEIIDGGKCSSKPPVYSQVMKVPRKSRITDAEI